MPPNSNSLPLGSASPTAARPVEGAALRAYTWQEVAKHNTADSAFVIIDGHVYDITGFMDKHPGGREMMLLSAGRECTDLFTMYHCACARARARARARRPTGAGRPSNGRRT